MAEPPRHYSWEDYLYPPDAAGEEVLRNKLDITDANRLRAEETRLTIFRVAELRAQPQLIDRTFDGRHWQAIHQHLFQDVYEWAGQFRTVDMSKGGHPFAPNAHLPQLAEEILSSVRAAAMFAGRDRAAVIDGLMYTMEGLNLLHPFREGNGRTQRVFTDHVADHAGYAIDWTRIGADEQNDMMARAYTGNRQPLRAALERSTIAIIRGGAVDASPWPTGTPVTQQAPDFWRLKKPLTQVLAEAAEPTASAQPQQVLAPYHHPGLER